MLSGQCKRLFGIFNQIHGCNEQGWHGSNHIIYTYLCEFEVSVCREHHDPQKFTCGLKINLIISKYIISTQIQYDKMIIKWILFFQATIIGVL